MNVATNKDLKIVWVWKVCQQCSRRWNFAWRVKNTGYTYDRRKWLSKAVISVNVYLGLNFPTMVLNKSLSFVIITYANVRCLNIPFSGNIKIDSLFTRECLFQEHYGCAHECRLKQSVNRKTYNNGRNCMETDWQIIAFRLSYLPAQLMTSFAAAWKKI